MKLSLPWIGYGALWMILIICAGAPIITVLSGGLSSFYLAEALQHPVFREGLLNAFIVACKVTVLCFCIALTLAWISWRYRFRGSGIAEALLLAPLVLPPFVGSLGIFQLLGTYGVFNTFGSHLGLWAVGHGPDWLGNHRLAVICLVEAFSLYPMLYLTLSASFGRLDGSLIEAAAMIGAGRWTTFRRVVAPLLKPGLFAGGSVIFVWSFTELGTPLLLGLDRITSVQVFYGLNDIQNDNQLPLALVVIMLVVVTLCYGGGKLLAGRSSEALVVKGQTGSGVVTLRGARALLAWLPFMATVLIAAAPHLTVVLLSIAHDWY